jgi:hypothetical protein
MRSLSRNVSRRWARSGARSFSSQNIPAMSKTFAWARRVRAAAALVLLGGDKEVRPQGAVAVATARDLRLLLDGGTGCCSAAPERERVEVSLQAGAGMVSDGVRQVSERVALLSSS